MQGVPFWVKKNRLGKNTGCYRLYHLCVSVLHWILQCILSKGDKTHWHRAQCTMYILLFWRCGKPRAWYNLMSSYLALWRGSRELTSIALNLQTKFSWPGGGWVFNNPSWYSFTHTWGCVFVSRNLANEMISFNFEVKVCAPSWTESHTSALLPYI